MTDSFNPVPPTPIREITPEQVDVAFHATVGQNNRFQVSLQKEQMRPDRQEQSINQNCSELSEEDRQAFISFCKEHPGRLVIHLYRLLNNGRSNAEKLFGVAFISQHDSLEKEIESKDREMADRAGEDEPLDFDNDRLNNVFSSESTDSGMFWTFAPYVYKNLLAKGIESKNALERIFAWGLRKNTTKDELKDNRGWHLSGLVGSDAVVLLEGMYYLSIDPNDLTHKFTDQEARKMVDKGIFNSVL